MSLTRSRSTAARRSSAGARSRSPPPRRSGCSLLCRALRVRISPGGHGRSTSCAQVHQIVKKKKEMREESASPRLFYPGTISEVRPKKRLLLSMPCCCCGAAAKVAYDGTAPPHGELP